MVEPSSGDEDFIGTSMRGFTESPSGKVIIAAVCLLVGIGIVGATSTFAQGSAEYVDAQFGFRFEVAEDWRIRPGEVVDPYTYVWEVQAIAPGDDYRALIVSVQPMDDVSTSSRDWA